MDATSNCRRDIDISSGGSVGKFTSRQGDGSNGHRTDPEGAGERHRGKRRRMTVGASRAGASDMPGSPCRELKDDNKTPGQPSDLEQVLRQREGNANRRGLECMRWCTSNSSATKSRQLYRLRSSLASVLSQDRLEASQRKTFSPWKHARTDRPRRLLAMTKRNWDSVPKKTHISNEELHRKFGIVQIAMRLSSRRLRMVKRMAG